MPVPTTTADLAAVIRKSRLLADDQLAAYTAARPHLDSPDAVVRSLQADGLLTPFQAAQLLKGRHKGFVLGKYRLLDRIGMGGMGQVYLAEHTAMRRQVAVKVLPPDRGRSEFARERFLREARAAAALEHPNLVRAFDIEMDGDVAYLVMEYLDGTTLHELVHRRGPLDPARAADYLRQVALGLSAVHERSLVHRDIKPGNLILDRAGVVRVLDLGLVRSELDDDALTRGEGATMVGTADYLAPEQAISCSTVDGRADLYSLGCTAYYLLTGQPPFPVEKVPQKILAHQMQEPRPLQSLRPEIPLGLAAVVRKLMAKKPGDRYPSATEAAAALAAWSAGARAPDAADFVPNPVVTGTVTNPSRLTLAGRPAGTPSHGSAIRFTPDPTWMADAQANQPTAATAGEDTSPNMPRPRTPEPRFVPEPEVDTGHVAELFGVGTPPAAGPSWVAPLVAAAAVVAAAVGGFFLMR